jgi:hypothetical protein
MFESHPPHHRNWLESGQLTCYRRDSNLASRMVRNWHFENQESQNHCRVGSISLIAAKDEFLACPRSDGHRLLIFFNGFFHRFS